MSNLFDLSVEVTGIAAMVSGLSIQIGNNKGERLTTSAMVDALYGVQIHLNRIASDLEELSVVEGKAKVVA